MSAFMDHFINIFLCPHSFFVFVSCILMAFMYLVFVYFFLLSAASILHKIHLRHQKLVRLDTSMMVAMNLQCGCISLNDLYAAGMVFTS